LFENGKDIMTKILELLIDARDEDRCRFSEDQIAHLCDSYAKLLTVWDAVFACSQRDNPTDADYEELEKLVKFGMKMVRELEMRVTPTLHCCERHLKDNVKAILMFRRVYEQWMELYYQTGSNFDVKHRHRKSLEQLATMRIKRTNIENLPQVQKLIVKKDTQHTRKKRKSTIEKEEADRIRKEARRNVLVESFGETKLKVPRKKEGEDGGEEGTANSSGCADGAVGSRIEISLWWDGGKCRSR
jgi:hypothetical protein